MLEQAGVGSIYSSDKSFVIPSSDNPTLVSVSDSEITLKSTSLNSRITPVKTSKLETSISIQSLQAFIADIISLSSIQLNHFGISYYCTDIETEIENIKSLLGDDKLYEEDSGISTTKWLFVGDANDSDKPMFELILNERSGPVLSSWVPHFQIDIDTTLSSDELNEVIKRHLGAGWVKWTIDVEGIGIPLVMGRLCSIDGLKVYLGIGTDKRDRAWHRRDGMSKL